MEVLFRQFTAWMLSAAVLATSIYCACGGHIDIGLAQAEPQAERVERHPGCTGHGEAHHDNHNDAQHGRSPEPCHDGDSDGSGCQHCQPAVAVFLANAKELGKALAGPSELALVTSVLPTHFSFASSQQPRGFTAADLPPRVADDTLLGLRCALTL